MKQPDIHAEIGKLIEQRKAYKGEVPIFERFNILVSLLREWIALPRERLEIAKKINLTRGELAERGVSII